MTPHTWSHNLKIFPLLYVLYVYAFSLFFTSLEMKPSAEDMRYAIGRYSSSPLFPLSRWFNNK